MNPSRLIPLILLGLSFVVFESCKLRRNTLPVRDQEAKERILSLPDNDNILLGMPSAASSDTADHAHYLLRKKQYVLSYNASEGIPNWVCWHLEKEDLGTAKRSNRFRADTSLPTNFYRVRPSEYARSGYDKGHNCPSADRTSSTEDNEATFEMSNMIPQAPDNNRITWEHLERFLRRFIRQNMEAYIMMGSYSSITDSSHYLSNGRVKIPGRIWKVAILLPQGHDDIRRLDTTAIVIAVDTPNLQGLDHNWNTYLTTVNKIDSAGGYRMLSALPDSIRAVLAAKKYSGN